MRIRRIRPLVIVATMFVMACDVSSSSLSARSVRSVRSAAALVDSARADSIALANLPARQAEEFSVRTLLTAAALRDTARVSCDQLSAIGAPTAPEARRRLHATLPDSSRAVLFARTALRTGTLHRVELVRRHVDGTQRGFIWDIATDAIETIEWPANGGRPEVTTLPRGEPTARALRALGRQLLVLPCRDTITVRHP